MKKFSKSKLFQIEYPDDWVYIEDMDPKIYSFCKEGNFNNGILHISAHTSTKKIFDARQENRKNKESELIQVNGYKIVFFETTSSKNTILNWHTGYKNTFILISYITDKKSKDEIKTIHNIIKSLKIKLIHSKKRVN